MHPALRHFYYSSSRGGYSEEYQAFLDRVTALEYTAPGDEYKTKGNRLVASVKRGGAVWQQTETDLWASIKILYILAIDAAGNARYVNLISPTEHQVTEQGGALNQTVDGVAGGSANAANTNWIPSTSDVIGANDISVFGWFTSIVSGMFGTENDSLNRLRLLSTDFAVNCARETHVAFTTDGSYMINRDASSPHKFWNGIHKITGSGVAAALSTVALYFSGRNTNGTLTSFSTRTAIFGAGKSMVGDEMVIHAIMDEYMNGAWPFTRTYNAEITPTPSGDKDYPAFPDLLVGRVGDNTGKYFWSYRFGPDHNLGTVVDEVLQISTDKGATWGAQLVIVDDSFGKNVTLTGASGTANVTIDGVDYLATFNTSLTQTATDWVTTHGATLAALGITVQSSGAVIIAVKDNHTEITAAITGVSGGLDGTISAGVEVTDNALGESNLGTVLYFYCYNLTQISTRRLFFVKRSTDDGVSFGDPIELTSDFNPNGQIAGPGGSITLANNRILKAVYANTTGAGTRRAYIYYSDDDGLTWTQLSVMSTDDAADYEEPTIRLLPNGNILGLLRSDPLDGTYYTVSTDSGATWSAVTYHSPSVGKNAIAVNPDGLIITIGRWPGNANTDFFRAMISYAHQDDLTTWRWRFTDEVDNWYMYAGADWDAASSCFASIYARETNNDFLSPTKMILQKWA